MMRALVFLSVMAFSTGCSSFGKKLKAFLGGQPVAEEAQPQVARQPSSTKFSDSPNHLTGPRRQYKRVTKKTLEDEALLNPSTGSLWVMEGQGAYLFSQNVVRMIGDPVAVRLEGDPKDQLSTKANVIKKLLDQLEARAKAQQAARARRIAAATGALQKPEGEGESNSESAAAPAAANAQQPQKPDNGGDAFNVKTVTTRVVERTVDGNYRVKGSQPFMIGNREYKVIVTGIVRAEDFNEDGISAKDLMDPSYDIVGVRKEM